MAKIKYNKDKIPCQPVDGAGTTANDAATRAARLKASKNVKTKTFGCDYGQILSPIEINKSPDDITDKFPSFQKIQINKSESGGGFASRTQDGTDGGLIPYSEDLDPYFYTGGNKDLNDRSPIIEGKTDINTVHNTSKAKESAGEAGDLNVRKNDTIDQVRTVGLKGPVLLSSWGYDMGGKPVPAKAKQGDDSFRFKPFFAARRSLWKTGPVHLLWDEERQVWTGGLPMLMGVATTDIEAPEDPTQPTQFTIQVLRHRGEPSANGNGASGGVNTCEIGYRCNNGFCEPDAEFLESLRQLGIPIPEGTLPELDPPVSCSSNQRETSSENPFTTLPGENAEELELNNFDPSLSQKVITKNREGDHDWEENPSLVWVLAIKMNYTWIPFYVGCPPECVESSDCVNLYREEMDGIPGADSARNWECDNGECVFTPPDQPEEDPEN
jgi:hypothetical protein